MSYHFIDKKDPRIDVMFQGLEKMERMLSVMEDVPRSLFNLSLIHISRRSVTNCWSLSALNGTCWIQTG